MLDISLLKLLLGLFVGVPHGPLAVMLMDCTMELCKTGCRSEPFANLRKTRMEIALLLIHHGACLFEVAQSFYSMPVKMRRRCPAELAEMLERAPGISMEADPVEDKRLLRDHD